MILPRTIQVQAVCLTFSSVHISFSKDIVYLAYVDFIFQPILFYFEYS